MSTATHHAFVLEAGAEEGIDVARAWAHKELGLEITNNPDIVVMRYGLLSVEDARKLGEIASGAAFAGEAKVVIIAASRAYHEAQNALLKLFEEPPPHTYLFLILPSLGGLLPTLRSRVQILQGDQKGMIYRTSSFAAAEEFLTMSGEKRSALIKKLATGKDDEARRENREKAIEIVNGIEKMAYAEFQKERGGEAAALLSDISTVRSHLYDRSAPLRMILEHLSLVIPANLR